MCEQKQSHTPRVFNSSTDDGKTTVT